MVTVLQCFFIKNKCFSFENEIFNFVKGKSAIGTFTGATKL